MPDIFVMISNIILNVINVIGYVMPFWIFDSASYFIDIYANPAFITILFLFTTLMGIFFLIYFLELLNIPIDPAASSQKTKEEQKNEETFLGATLGFIFWKSNIYTYWPKFLSFIWQLRYKLIPIFLILMIMYTPFFPTSRWYNTVGEFFHANRDFVMYTIYGKDYMSKNDIDRLLKYNWLSKNDKENNVLLYKNNTLILKQLTTNTISNSDLNDSVWQEVNMYTKVYDKDSYNKYISWLTSEKNILSSTISDLNAQKDAASNKEKIKDLIIKINEANKKKVYLDNSIKNAKSVYNSLTYKIDKADLSKLQTRLTNESWYKNILLSLTKNKLNLKTWKIQEQWLKDDYNSFLSILKSYDGTTKLNENTPNTVVNNLTINLNKYLFNETNTNKIAHISEIQWMVTDEINSLTSLPNIDTINSNIQKLNSELSQIDKDLNNISNISESPTTRLNYIIDENALALSAYNIWENEKERQRLLLLQYQLINKKDQISQTDSKKIQLLQNKVEYIWFNAIKNFWIFLSIISVIFTFTFYLTLILLAWWKNMLLIYISIMSFISNKVEGFIWKEKSEWINKHISLIVQKIFGDDRWLNNNSSNTFWNWTDTETNAFTIKNATDPEFTWFQEHMNNRDVYIGLLVEVVVRLGLIFWLLFY